MDAGNEIYALNIEYFADELFMCALKCGRLLSGTNFHRTEFRIELIEIIFLKKDKLVEISGG